MTQSQRDAITAATAKLFAAQDREDAETANMSRAQAAKDAAQQDALYGAPARAAKVIQDAKDALARSEAAFNAQFQISSAAHLALNEAQTALEQAIRDSRQSGTVGTAPYST